MKAVRERFRTHFKCNETAAKRLFISRQKAPRRKIVNEEALLPLLKKYRFEPVVLEDLTFAEQVKLAGQAQAVVGLHGAGLTNILWMLPKTKVLEIRFRGDSHNNCYFSLASALDIDYHYVLADQTDSQKAIRDADALLDSGVLD